ncbi:MAG: EAL domain-containing protein [Negativicutes bacterium]|nr:EAL domain-containing protein [Negativicutes bacterium]
MEATGKNDLAVLHGDVFYKSIMEQARNIILIVAPDGKIIDANLAAIDAYGYTRSEIRELNVRDLRSPATRNIVDAQLKIAQQEGINFRTVHMRRNGELFPVEVSSRAVRTGAGEVVVSIVRDISAAIAMENAAKERERRLQELYEQLMAAHEELTAADEELRQQFEEVLAREAEIRRQNTLLQSFQDIMAGLMRRQELDELLPRIIEGATELVGTPHGFVYLLDQTRQVFCRRYSTGICKKDIGGTIPVDQGIVGEVYKTGEPVIANDYAAWREKSPYLAAFKEIQAAMHVPLQVEGRLVGTLGLAYCESGRAFGRSEVEVLSRFAELASVALDNAMLLDSLTKELQERKVQEQAIRRMAYYDSLTGLPNRLLLQESLENELAQAQRGEAEGTVLFIDIDDLKIVNDTFGHSHGDRVITRAGAYLLAAAGENDLVARIGGDEFMLMLRGITEVAQISRIAANILQALNRDYEIEDVRINISASIGIARYPLDGMTVDDIFKKADIAMYAAKGRGKNTWHFYNPSLQTAVNDNMMVRQGLRQAIARQELSLNFQPIVDAASGRVVCFEALLRWTSPEYGKVSPARFIPLAEESGAIHTIGKWVMHEACRFARKLAASGKNDIYVAVNVSPRQIAAEDFLLYVREAIEQAAIHPRQLAIEITENALIASLTDGSRKLTALREMGVRLALDDFGTGYSSLTYLRSLPVETLKIDKSFIEKIAADATQIQYTRFIVDMAHMLKLAVVAEGVETPEQRQKLLACRCDFMQGYLFSRPLPEREALLLVEAEEN